MKIAFTTPLPPSGFSRLVGHELGVPMSEAQVLVSTFDYKVSSDLIATCPHLRLITNFGVGFNNIDLAACKERAIYVTNTPTPVIEPTAELTFALMHAVARRTCELDRKLREHRAEPFGVMNNLGHTLYGKVLGIIGMGNIGKALARRAIASGMTILHSPSYGCQHRVALQSNLRYERRLTHTRPFHQPKLTLYPRHTSHHKCPIVFYDET